MTTYPTLVPNSINFDFGYLNLTEVGTFAGPVRFRHSRRVSGNALRITYRGLTQTQVQQIRTHYNQNQGTHGYFSVPSDIWGGLTVVGTDAVYRYAERPEEEHIGLYYNVAIVLRIIDGLNLLYIFDGDNASVPATTPFTSFAFTGYAPFTLNGGTADPASPAATHILEGGGA